MNNKPSAFTTIPRECWYCQYHEVFSDPFVPMCSEVVREMQDRGFPVLGELRPGYLDGDRFVRVNSKGETNCPLWQVMDYDKAKATIDDEIVEQFRGQWG